MRIFGFDANGVLTETFDRLRKTPGIELTDDARSADHFLFWQDVRGGCLTVCELNRDYMGKPVTLVQHGRGAMRDYLPPNSFQALADTLCVWGEADADHLRRAGYGSRARITGSPLKNLLKGRAQRSRKDKEGLNILYVPIIADHEQPENLINFYHLKRLELDRCIERLETAKQPLKDLGWNAWNLQPGTVTDGTIPWSVLNSEFRIITKLAQGFHDASLYYGHKLTTYPHNRVHQAETLKLLECADVVVAVEEGTLPLLAMALDIPVVIIDGFQYHNYGGVDYSTVEMIRTRGATYTDLAHLRATLEYSLSHPEHLRAERQEVVERELCPKGIQDPVAEIIDVVTSNARLSNAQKVEVTI